jgi:hypothetical protein
VYVLQATGSTVEAAVHSPSTTGYTDQIVDHDIVAVRFARTKFWLNSLAQHAAPPHSASDQKSSDAQIVLCASMRPTPLPRSALAVQG